MTDAVTVANGYENTFAQDLDSDGLLSGGSFYQLASDSGAVTLRHGNGGTLSDSSTSKWDVIAAKQTSTGFDVLFQGGGTMDGKNMIWSTNGSGTYVSGTSWMTDAVTVANGYENTFGVDINNDGFIS